MILRKKRMIRTDFILQNVFSHMLKGYYSFVAIRPINNTEKKVFDGIKETVTAFRGSYSNDVKRLCTRIDAVNEDTVDSVLLGVHNELFSDGITWSRIIAYIVFVGELTIMCLSKKMQESIVDYIYKCFSILVKEKLESWIEDHDGWEGMCLLIATQSRKMLYSSLLKSFFNSVIRIMGTFAAIYNTLNDF